MDKDREDFDPNEWGNIELPGLTDEELHSKNWNRITGLRDYYKTETVEKRRKKGAKISKTKLNGYHPTRGVPNSVEQKRKISEALTGKNKPPRSKKHRQAFMKPCMTPDGAFESAKAATDHWGYKWRGNVHNKITKGHAGWRWITKEEYDQYVAKMN